MKWCWRLNELKKLLSERWNARDEHVIAWYARVGYRTVLTWHAVCIIHVWSTKYMHQLFISQNRNAWITANAAHDLVREITVNYCEDCALAWFSLSLLFSIFSVARLGLVVVQGGILVNLLCIFQQWLRLFAHLLAACRQMTDRARCTVVFTERALWSNGKAEPIDEATVCGRMWPWDQ